jgi:hypothetical protein
MIIRREQLEQFIAPDDASLTRVVRQAVRAANGARVGQYSDEDLDAMVRIGIARARSRGLTFAEDIAAFVAIMFEVAPRFDEQADINAMLLDESLPVELRLETLFARTADPAWSDAEKKYEDSFWFAK